MFEDCFRSNDFARVWNIEPVAGLVLPGDHHPGVAWLGADQPGVALPGDHHPGVALPGGDRLGVDSPEDHHPGVALCGGDH